MPCAVTVGVVEDEGATVLLKAKVVRIQRANPEANPDQEDPKARAEAPKAPDFFFFSRAPKGFFRSSQGFLRGPHTAA